MKAYIQQKDGDWVNKNAYLAKQGLHILGYDIIPFEPIEGSAPDVEYGEDDIVFGGIPIALDAMDKMGIERPEIVDYPKELEWALRRKVEVKKVKEIRQMANEEFEPVFIKPYAGEKKFTGFLFENFLGLLQIAHLGDEEEVWCSEPMKIISEYRVYFLNDEIIASKHYAGNSMRYPNSTSIMKMFHDYKSKKVAGSIDVALVEDEEKICDTVLVEVNDAYGLGNYGISHIHYAQMIQARWKEMRG